MGGLGYVRKGEQRQDDGKFRSVSAREGPERC